LSDALTALWFCAAPLYICLRHGQDGRRMLALQRPAGKRAIWICLAVAVAFPWLIKLAEGWIAANMPLGFYRKPEGLTKVWEPTVAAIIVAPLTEELLFRGYILGGALRRGVRPAVAVVLTTFLFSIIHSQYQGVGVAMAFGAGVVFSLMRLSTNSLVLPVLAHILVNAHKLFT
jgi:membrane protease YdiL (CAAX protease family)